MPKSRSGPYRSHNRDKPTSRVAAQAKQVTASTEGCLCNEPSDKLSTRLIMLRSEMVCAIRRDDPIPWRRNKVRTHRRQEGHGMALFHFNTSVVQRSAGRSVVAAAAWQRGITLHDDRLGRNHAFATRGPGFCSDILLPPAANPAWRDPAVLWDAVEAHERRKDSQLARCFRMALPHELSARENVDLVRSFVRRIWLSDEVAADITVRLVNAAGEPSPFAAVLATTRPVIAVDGHAAFGKKLRSWNTRPILMTWRMAWADSLNQGLEAAGSAARVDHRAMAARDPDVEPQSHVGVVAKKRHERGLRSDRVIENAAIVRRRSAHSA